jgi:iron complex outermembrane recepter protein
MRLPIIFFLLLVPVYACIAQSNDSIKVVWLSEMTIKGVKTEGDTLQNFYRSNPAATTETILSRMNGVSLLRRGGYGQEPMLRGMTNGQINVVIDGVKIFGACTDRMDPVTIYVEPVNLSVIQSSSGIGGAEFGSTFGGSINLMLAEPMISEKKWSGRGGIDVQSSARGINYFSVLNMSQRKSAFRSSLSYRKNGNYHSGGGAEVSYSQYEKVNAGLSAKWTASPADTIQADAIFDRGWNIGFPALSMDAGSATAGIFSMTWRHVTPWRFLHHFKVKGYHNVVVHSMSDDFRPSTGMKMDMPGRSATSGLWAQGDVHLFHQHKTSVKIEYYSNRVLAEMKMFPAEGLPMYMQTSPESERNVAGLYMNQQFRTGKSVFDVFLRADLNRDILKAETGRKQWDVLSPGVSGSTGTLAKTFGVNFKYRVSGATLLTVQSGIGERAATLNERYGYFLFNKMDAYDYVGNPELKKERSFNLEMDLNFFAPGIEVQVSPYARVIRNYISASVVDNIAPMTPGSRGVKQNLNLNSARLSGIDAMMMVRLQKNVQWLTTMKYTYGVDGTRQPLMLVPPFKTVSSLKYQRKRAGMQAEVEYASAQERINREFGEVRSDAYILCNVRGSYRFKQRWSLNAGVENLLDRNYREHLDLGGIPRPGRNGYLNMVYTF